MGSGSGEHGTVKLGPAREYGAGTTPYYVSTADLNNDGALDFAVSTPDDASGMTTVDILQGTGTGTFTMVRQVSTSAPAETVISDFDHDGIRDIVGIAYDGQGPLPDFYLHGTGNFMYTRTTWGHARDFLPRLSAGDFNEDGTPELVAAYVDTEFGTGAAGFVIETMPADVVLQDELAFGAATRQAIAGDFNGDGHQDVVAASNAASVVQLFTGNGSGTVTAGAQTTLPGTAINAIAAFDLDRDGFSDLVATHFDGTATVSYGTATGFSAPLVLPVGGSGIAAGDFDHDGRLDLAFTSLAFSATTVQIFLATATGFVRGGTLQAPSGTGVNLAVGDYNSDGFDDLAAPSVSSVTVWLSTP